MTSGYYAANGRVARDPIEGGIEITREQYKAAIEALGDGRAIRIAGGALEIHGARTLPGAAVCEVYAVGDFGAVMEDEARASVATGAWPVAAHRFVKALPAGNAASIRRSYADADAAGRARLLARIVARLAGLTGDDEQRLVGAWTAS